MSDKEADTDPKGGPPPSSPADFTADRFVELVKIALDEKLNPFLDRLTRLEQRVEAIENAAE